MKKKLSGRDLKKIAYGAMIFQHIVVYMREPVGYMMGEAGYGFIYLVSLLVGCMAMPLFAVAAASGAVYSGNVNGYLKRLLLCTAASFIPYCYLIGGIEDGGVRTVFNILPATYTIFCGVLAYCFYDGRWLDREKKEIKIIRYGSVFLCLALGLLGDWGMSAGLCIVILARENAKGAVPRIKSWLVVMLVWLIAEAYLFYWGGIISGVVGMGYLLSLPFIAAYDGSSGNVYVPGWKRGKSFVYKNIFYILYPLHLWVLMIYRVIMDRGSIVCMIMEHY